ncbi:MAG: thiamine-phosphate kinase [Fibrobacteraceae bacterium]
MDDSACKFPPLGEFLFVNDVLKGACPLEETSPRSRFWFGAGDDCAAVDGWLVTTDMSVENSHYRLDWSTPEQAIEKFIVSNVSDISAMGGTPRVAFLGICHNKNWDKAMRDRVAKAFSEGFASRGISLAGGDTIVGDVSFFSATLLGTCDGKPLRRNAARPGDYVYVAGTLGKSDAGLWALMNGHADDPGLRGPVAYHLAPKINEKMGASLVRQGVVGACIDISDGLSSELHHIALSSGVRIEIEESLIPVEPAVKMAALRYGLPARKFWLDGGEEYQLLFTSSLPESIFFNAFGADAVTCIGRVVPGAGVILHGVSGEFENVKAGAWSHL